MITTLIKPIITEKSMRAAASGVYTFAVLLNGTKTQVKEAVETTFKVNVTRVNTTLRHIAGKTSGAKRLMGKSSRAKYALVRLKKGQSIDLFDLKETK